MRDWVKKRISNYWEDGRGKIVDKRREKKPERRAWKNMYSKKMNIKHKTHRQCRVRFNNWMYKKSGIKEKCCICGAIKVEAHHPNYSKPLLVAWMCPKDHKAVHRGKIKIKKSDLINYE